MLRNSAVIITLLTLGSAAWGQPVITPVARLLHVTARANTTISTPPDVTRDPDVYGWLSHQVTVANGTVVARAQAFTYVQPDQLSITANGSAEVNPPFSGSGFGSGRGVATVSFAADALFRVDYLAPGGGGLFRVRDADAVIVHEHSYPDSSVYELALPGGLYSFDFSYGNGSNPGGTSNGGAGWVEITVVPEPAGAALGLVASSVFALRRRLVCGLTSPRGPGPLRVRPGSARA